MRLIGVIAVAFLFGACHADVAAPDAGAEPDGSPHGLGLFVSWNANPALPGRVTDKLTVSDVSFQVDHLQLISDAGSDDRTIHSRYQLQWSTGVTPPQESFPDAPVAAYQKVVLDMRPGVQLPYAYRIEGTWRDDDTGEVKPFQIVDAMELSVPIACSAVLPAGGSVSVAIEVDLKDALEGVDFRVVGEEDGVRVLSAGPELVELRDRMASAFQLGD